jgi:hypothetical protein
MTTTLASSGHQLATMPGGTGNPVDRTGSAQSGGVVAWQLSEGDVMVVGETVLAVQREPVSGSISIVCDDQSRRTSRHESAGGGAVH